MLLLSKIGNSLSCRYTYTQTSGSRGLSKQRRQAPRDIPEQQASLDGELQYQTTIQPRQGLHPHGPRHAPICASTPKYLSMTNPTDNSFVPM